MKYGFKLKFEGEGLNEKGILEKIDREKRVDIPSVAFPHFKVKKGGCFWWKIDPAISDLQKLTF